MLYNQKRPNTSIYDDDVILHKTREILVIILTNNTCVLRCFFPSICAWLYNMRQSESVPTVTSPVNNSSHQDNGPNATFDLVMDEEIGR